MGLLGGGWKFKPPSVPAGEPHPTSWTDARLIQGQVASSGRVGITDNHLVYTPVDTDATRRVPVWLARLSGAPGAALATGRAMKRLENTGLYEPRTVPLSEIHSVEAVGKPSFASPPTVRVNLSSGQALELGALKSQASPNWSRQNSVAQRSLAQQLQDALARR